MQHRFRMSQANVTSPDGVSRPATSIALENDVFTFIADGVASSTKIDKVTMIARRQFTLTDDVGQKWSVAGTGGCGCGGRR